MTTLAWPIDWYVCTDKGKELYRLPRSIGPITIDHNHWAGNYLVLSHQQANLVSQAPQLLSLCEQALRALHEDDFPALRDELRLAIAVATNKGVKA